LLLQARVHAGV